MLTDSIAIKAASLAKIISSNAQTASTNFYKLVQPALETDTGKVISSNAQIVATNIRTLALRIGAISYKLMQTALEMDELASNTKVHSFGTDELGRKIIKSSLWTGHKS